MGQLKFAIKKQQTYKFKKLYSLRIADKKKTTKFKPSITLGTYIPKIKLYIFIYPKIFPFIKLGAIFSKQTSLISFFYLKQVLKKNLQ